MHNSKFIKGGLSLLVIASAGVVGTIYYTSTIKDKDVNKSVNIEKKAEIKNTTIVEEKSEAKKADKKKSEEKKSITNSTEKNISVIADNVINTTVDNSFRKGLNRNLGVTTEEVKENIREIVTEEKQNSNTEIASENSKEVTEPEISENSKNIGTTDSDNTNNGNSNAENPKVNSPKVENPKSDNKEKEQPKIKKVRNLVIKLNKDDVEVEKESDTYVLDLENKRQFNLVSTVEGDNLDAEDKKVTYSLEGNTSKETKIEESKLILGEDEIAENITIIATSAFDNTKNTKITLNLIHQEVTVEFVADLGIGEFSKFYSVKKGETIEKYVGENDFSAVVKEGYRFLGWKLENEEKIESIDVIKTKKVTKDTKYIAVFEQLQPTIDLFEVSMTSAVEGDESVTYDEDDGTYSLDLDISKKAKFIVNIEGQNLENAVNSRDVNYEIEGKTSDKTGFEGNTLVIGEDEKADTLTVKVTSQIDSTKTQTINIWLTRVEEAPEIEEPSEQPKKKVKLREKRDAFGFGNEAKITIDRNDFDTVQWYEFLYDYKSDLSKVKVKRNGETISLLNSLYDSKKGFTVKDYGNREYEFSINHAKINDKITIEVDGFETVYLYIAPNGNGYYLKIDENPIVEGPVNPETNPKTPDKPNNPSEPPKEMPEKEKEKEKETPKGNKKVVLKEIKTNPFNSNIAEITIDSNNTDTLKWYRFLYENMRDETKVVVKKNGQKLPYVNVLAGSEIGFNSKNPETYEYGFQINNPKAGDKITIEIAGFEKVNLVVVAKGNGFILKVDDGKTSTETPALPPNNDNGGTSPAPPQPQPKEELKTIKVKHKGYRAFGIRFNVDDSNTKAWLDKLKEEKLEDVTILVNNKKIERTPIEKKRTSYEKLWFVGPKDKPSSSIQVYGLYTGDIVTIKVKGYKDVVLEAVYDYDSDYILELIKN